MSEHRSTNVRFAIALPLIHAALMSVLLLLFTWPAATAEPRNVPIGLVGPAKMTEAIAETIDSQRPGAFSIEFFDTASEATSAIESKEIYGAIEVGAQTRTYVATAGNSGVSQLVNELGSAINESMLASQGISIPILEKIELAPLPDEDPRGQVLGSAALPFVVAGISLGALTALRGGNRWSQISIVAAGAVITGLSLAYILTQGIAVLPGEIWINALAISSVIGAVSTTLLGAHRLTGMAGLGTMAATFFLLGNPLSGVSIPAEFYVEGWGVFGQSLPLGAGFELIKRINFFELAETSPQWWVLASWMVFGLSLWGLSFLRRATTIDI